MTRASSIRLGELRLRVEWSESEGRALLSVGAAKVAPITEQEFRALANWALECEALVQEWRLSNPVRP